MSARCRVVGLLSVMLMSANAGWAGEDGTIPSIQPSHGEEGQNDWRNDFRTPIIGPSPPEQGPRWPEPPEEEQILRALPPVKRLVGLFEESRDNIEIVTEQLPGESKESVRHFPLIGMARVNHSRWKCAVYYTDTITGRCPFPFRWSQPRTEIVYVDSEQLRLVSDDADREKAQLAP